MGKEYNSCRDQRGARRPRGAVPERLAACGTMPVGHANGGIWSKVQLVRLFR